MSNQLLKDPNALRMFFTEPVYITATADENIPVTPEEKTAPIEIAIEQQPINTEQKPVHFEFIGKNNRNILILVNDISNKVSSPEGTELLRNIVKHLQFDAADFALLNYAAYPTATFEQLQTFFKSRSILAFGVTPMQLGLENTTISSSVIKDTQTVFGPNLHIMTENLEAKKAFWATLKTVEKW